jgi:predicted phosphodiesterase
MNNKTNIYEFTDAKHVVVAGDIHGDFEALVYKCCVQYCMTDTLIIVAGDCGFGFQRPVYYEDIYKKVRNRLSKANNWFVFVRGNHDNPAYFDGQQVKYKRWKAVPDYSVLKVCGHTILCVGGAISVDRSWRKLEYLGRTVVEGEDERFLPEVYWPDEKPVYDEAKLAAINEVCAIDVVVTHTAPSFCELKSKRGIENWIYKDEDLEDDIKAERKVMDNIQAYLYAHSHPVDYWFYGHFHQSWHDEIDGIKYNMLDVKQVHQLDYGDDYIDTEYEKRMARLAELASKIRVF